MKILVDVTSGKLEDHIKVLNKYNFQKTKKDYYGELEINSLEDLYKLQVEIENEIIISSDPWDNSPRIEIYDYYRE